MRVASGTTGFQRTIRTRYTCRVSRSQLTSALSNWFAFAATLAVAFFLTPYLIRHLGTAKYDVWCVAEAILAYFTLLDMGLAACLMRGVARHHAVKDSLGLNRMASTCLALFSVAGTVALLLGVPVMFAFAAKRPEVLPFLLIMLANLAVTLPLSVFPSILDGLDRYAAKSAVRILFLAIRTIAIVAIVPRNAGLMPLAIIVTITNIFEHALLALLAFRFLPALRFRFSLLNRESFREIRRFSIDAFLAMLAGRITVQTSVILVGLLLPAGAVTIFATASRLVEYAKTLLRTITATLTPGVSALEARGDWDGIRQLFLSATRFVLYLVLPIQMGLLFFGTPFLVRWVPEVGTHASMPLAILSLTLTLSVAQSVASRMLYGLGRLRLFARLALAEAGMNLLCILTMIPAWELTGVAIAVAVPNILLSIAVILHALKVLSVPSIDYLKIWFRPAFTIVIPCMIWSRISTVEPTWISIFSSIAYGLFPYGIAILIMESPKAHLLKPVGLARFLPRRRQWSNPR